MIGTFDHATTVLLWMWDFQVTYDWNDDEFTVNRGTAPTDLVEYELLADYLNRHAPEGFSVVGMGAYRVVVLHKESGVVYKVNHAFMRPMHDSNGMEYEWYRRATMHEWNEFVLPETFCWYPEIGDKPHTRGEKVIAMQFIDGDFATDEDVNVVWEETREKKLQLYDLHTANLKRGSDGNLYVIDMGG